MTADPTIVPLLAVLFLATLIRSAFGFGEALVAVPLLSLFLPVEVAAPLAVLVSITVALVVLAQDWRDVQVASAGRLVLATAAGIPLGLFLLAAAPEPLVKAALAVVIIAFSAYHLAGRVRYELKDDRRAWLFGLGAGVLGGAYGMNGPPLVVYGTLRRWPPERFRATLQGYFLPASVAGMAGYWLAGLWGPDVTRYYFTSLPAVAAAIAAGRALNRRLDRRAFLTYVHVGLITVGAVLLVQAARPARAARNPPRAPRGAPSQNRATAAPAAAYRPFRKLMNCTTSRNPTPCRYARPRPSSTTYAGMLDTPYDCTSPGLASTSTTRRSCPGSRTFGSVCCFMRTQEGHQLAVKKRIVCFLTSVSLAAGGGAGSAVTLTNGVGRSARNSGDWNASTVDHPNSSTRTSSFIAHVTLGPTGLSKRVPG
jgi:uncharacterized membrane protein YfcA